MIGRRTFLGTLAVPLLAHADDDPLARIARAKSKMRSLAGPFTQARTIGLLKSVVTSRGTLTLLRPDRLRWDLLAPDEVSYWVTPEGLAYRSRSGAARVSGAQTPRLSAALADLRAILGDLTPLRARYAIEARIDDAGATVEANAREPANAAFKRLTLELARDLVRPTRATLIEGPRDRTEITFGELTVDGPVDPALFVVPR
jgi:outer membrane lipoprotein-sorting protein